MTYYLKLHPGEEVSMCEAIDFSKNVNTSTVSRYLNKFKSSNKKLEFSV